jgi:ubiquinone/menaquinone biosynthesis C-methylase UbiE
MTIRLIKELTGNILDIGGGGEGVIGRLYRNQVTAIDNRQEELDEAPAGFEKALMDATDLKFADCSFSHATFFFTMMFMSTEEQKQSIMEAVRVLKKGGELHILDCDIASAYPKPFCIDVEVQLPSEHVSTTYGVGKQDQQDRQSISQMCADAGLVLVTESVGEDGYYLRFKKEE